MLLLNRLVVNPRFAGMRLEAHRMMGNFLTGFVMSNDPDESTQFRYDLRHGIIQLFQPNGEKERMNKGSLANPTLEEWITSTINFTTSTKIMMEREMNELQRTLSIFDQLKDVTKLRVIAALANYQVEGSDVSKGLRAAGFQFEGKIVKNYLGGWEIEGQPNFEHFIRSL